MTRPDVRLTRGAMHHWHVAINAHSTATGFASVRFMYEAKECAEEVPRLALLFEAARTDKLAKMMHRCSHDHEGTPVPENHLTCCLGVKCAACPHLLALDAAAVTDAERDVLKAWTCASHILTEGGDTALEGYITTVDDRLYGDSVHSSLMGDAPAVPRPAGAEPTDHPSTERH